MTSNSKILGLILAGGRSRRMGGRDKFLLPFGEDTLLDHIISRARPQVEGLALSYNGEAEKVAATGLPVVRDTIDDPGPLGGILAGLRAAEGRGFDYLLSFAGDVPFVPENYAARLCAALEDGNCLAAVARSGDRTHPVMGLWPVALADDLEACLLSGERRVMTWLARHNYEKVVWDEIPDPFMNINTPDDLDRARKLLG
ncbi:molybdenum cofactor guanylyltransferase MobA [Emcibacter nanhaiensis]|uniref:Molybdenum cofactor guanylyltransferase n=1 Tax=Emcibacter nanhaiensis TaxID=1505037 RepID=A0A501PMP2_9PROT|nr:molybdenum cofactor guanylyltransferase MobA [Emcibacter nanhaiensis]TPD61392.1 molybdenum cofactor guanylyltransferase [Emcibacter nanhaiensis]